METTDFFDLKNEAANPYREAIAAAAAQLISQSGTMRDKWSPFRGAERYELDSPWDGGVFITVTGQWSMVDTSVDKAAMGVAIAKRSQRHGFPPVEPLYGLFVAQIFDDETNPVQTIVEPLIPPEVIKRRQRRQQEQKAGNMALRLLRDFPASRSQTLWQPLGLES